MADRGRVSTQAGLRLRAAPVDGDVLAVLPFGSELEVLGGDAWLHVRAGDLEGFVSAEFVERESADASAGEQVVNIRLYTNSQFAGEPVRADADFEPHLDRLNGFARDCAVKIVVTSSFRQPGQELRGTVVQPAQMSNHLVGHAIDMNLQSATGLFNSSALRRANLANLPVEPRRFIQAVRDDPALRWGGDFATEDPVHIDDGLNVRDAALWQRKFRAL
jgi:hypothetical protein